MQRDRFTAYFIASALMAGWALFAGGCSSDAKPQSAKAASSIADVRKELTAGRKQVETTVAALNGVQSAQGDLRPAVGNLNKQIAATEKMSADMAKRAAGMRAKSAEYQKKWREERAGIDNPDLKAAADARAEKIKNRYATITEHAHAAREAYQPFLSNIKEVQTYLTNDMTRAAVDAAKPAFDKSNAQAQELLKKIDVVIADLDDVAGSMSPVAPAAK